MVHIPKRREGLFWMGEGEERHEQRMGHDFEISSEDVTVEQILGYLRANAAMAQKILRHSVPLVAARTRDCGCANALRFAIVTDPKLIPSQIKRELKPIIGRYIP